MKRKRLCEMRRLVNVMHCVTLLGFFLFLFSSCTDDNVDEKVESSVNKSNVRFMDIGGTQTLEVTSTGDWTIAGIPDWCQVSPSAGGAGTTTVSITVIRAYLEEDRNAVLTIGEVNFSITQRRTGALTLTPSKLEVTDQGETVEVEVVHNINFGVTIPSEYESWIKQAKTRALSSTKLNFTIEPSTEYSKRNGIIVIYDLENTGLSDTIHVYQAQKDHLVLTDDNQTINYRGGRLNVELKTNIDYEILIPEEATWIKQVAMRSLRADVATFSVDSMIDQNDNREVVITFKDKNSDLSDELVLCQLADGALFLMKSIFYLEAKGGIVPVKLKEMDFSTEVIDGKEWLTPIPFNEVFLSSIETSLRTDSLRFIGYSNYEYKERLGRILVRDNTTGATDTIKVYQKAKDFTTNTEGTTRLLWGSVCQLKNASTGIFQADINKILLSWRMLPNDTEETAFDLYRKDGDDWVKLNVAPILNTNFRDETVDLAKNNAYKLCYTGSDVVIDEYTMTATEAAAGPYIAIKLKETASDARLGSGFSYNANDASVGDLDGDGKPEVIIRRIAVANAEDSGDEEILSLCPNIIEAYKLDGSFVWRILLGPNIPTSNVVAFAVYDLDKDGLDEITLRMSEGAYFGDGVLLGDTNEDGVTNYAVAGVYNSKAPEFLCVLEGSTGRELARAPYIPIGTSEEWGDNYFKRANSLRVTVAELGGVNASPIACRGIYNKMVLQAWDYNGSGQPMTERWIFNTGSGGGEYDAYRGQGNHQISVADVDADGFDEITYGACAIDHDGKGLYTTRLGHGDMLHVGDFDPTRAGLECFQCYETGKTNVSLRDARTGQQIWANLAVSDGDMGRAVIADIDPASPGCEMWMYKSSVYSIDGQVLSTSPAVTNFVIWFSGLLNRQLMDGNTIDQYGVGRVFTMYRYDATSNNDTKKNPCFYGDFLGDWREEVISPISGQLSTEIRIFSTWYPTDYKFSYLMSDHVYRMSVCNQNLGYNSPNQLGYYLGSDLYK